MTTYDRHASAPASDEFVEQVRDAYEHLYDLVYLRTHPLLAALINDADLPRHRRAWQLHELLIQAIDELDPGPDAPVLSREWRRYRLMMLRYVDGLSPEETADRLAISVRQLYRELGSAMQAIATVIWDRCERERAQRIQGTASEADMQAPGLSDRVELLRIEAARASTAGHHTRLSVVVDGLLPLLAERLEEHGIQVQLEMPADLPLVAPDQALIRQLLLGLCGHLIERAFGATLRLWARQERDEVVLTIAMAPTERVATPTDSIDTSMASFAEMARASHAELKPLDAAVTGFEVRLPCAPLRTLLAIDDNQDWLDYLAHILEPAGYTVIPARTASEGIELAASLKPLAITLDLMMPEQDGWDLLRVLLERDDTRMIPVIVCSVLQQRELALSLGATAFLRKPVDEVALLALLDELRQS
ncbi:MAG: response regulator [Anaerolineales bacterium]